MKILAGLWKSRRLHSKARQLFDRRRKRSENFFVNQKLNEFEEKLAERNTPNVARSWHYSLNMGMDSFESFFKKHMPEIETERS